MNDYAYILTVSFVRRHSQKAIKFMQNRVNFLNIPAADYRHDFPQGVFYPYRTVDAAVRDSCSTVA